MRYFISFMIILLAACDSTITASKEMREDTAKVIGIFCEGQKKQFEITHKMAEYKEKGQLPGEEINEIMDEVNKNTEEYTIALQKLLEKYKGQERAIHNLLKEGQLNCK